MAGAGYKLFSTGDVLSASDVNTYLMQQTVMSFASSAARTTALASVLAEGMVTYLQDTNVVEIYTGAAWVSLDDPNAIQNSIVDAKGDIISATADNTPSRLAVGANDTVLTADSSTATGLKWAASSSGSYTLLTSGNLPTGANTVTISSLSTAYQDLVIEIYGVTFGSAAGYGVITGGVAWGRNAGTILSTDTSTGDSYSGTYPRFVDKTWTTQTANTMTIRVFNYSATYRKAYAYWGFLTDSSTTWGTTSGGGIDTATALSAITIFSIFGGSPNFTGGSYKIWGVK